jgi:type I restriction enzyme S subunit
MGSDSSQDVIVGDISAEKRNALVGGPFGSNLVSRDYVESGVPVIRGQNMGSGRWVTGDFVYVSEDKANSLSANLAQAGDIVFTQRGTLGQVAIIPENGLHEKYVISQSQMKLSPDLEKADPLYLYYEFTGPQQLAYIANNSIQTGVPHTNLTILRNTPLTLPPLPEQKAIAHILGSLDDKIELNRRMNATLEGMAQALFKSWFVDFDPVIDNALAAGNPIPDELAPRAEVRRQALANGTTQQGSLDHPTLSDPKSLFPAAFQFTEELGWIPEGWEVKPIEDCIQRFPAGKKYATKTAEETGAVPILDQGRSGLIGFHNDEPGVKASPGDPIIVFANHTCYMRLIMFDFSAIQNVLPFKGDGLNIFWLFEATKGRQKFNEYKGHWPDFVIKKLVVPTLPLVSIFGEIVEANYRKIYANELENQALTKLRDTLLPKLISGELRIPEAEQLTEEVLA